MAHFLRKVAMTQRFLFGLLTDKNRIVFDQYSFLKPFFLAMEVY